MVGTDDDYDDPGTPADATSYRNSLIDPHDKPKKESGQDSVTNNINKKNIKNSENSHYNDTPGLTSLGRLRSSPGRGKTQSSFFTPPSSSSAKAYLGKLLANRATPQTPENSTPLSTTTILETEEAAPNENTTTTEDEPFIDVTPPTKPKPPAALPLNKTATNHWIIAEIQKPMNTNEHIAEAFLDLLRNAHNLDSKVQFLPMTNLNPYKKTLTNLHGGRFPRVFTDNEAKQYLAKHHDISRDVYFLGSSQKVVHLHLELQLTTFADPFALISNLERHYLTTGSPRSKFSLHPLNSQTYSTIGYLHYSSLQINIYDLQAKINEATNITTYLKHDNIQRFLSPQDKQKGKNNIITVSVLPADSAQMIDELNVLYPLETENILQCHYLTCRKMVFLTRDDLLHKDHGFDSATLHRAIQTQIKYSNDEQSAIINFLLPVDTIITIPSTSQTTSIRAILVTLYLPIPPDIIVDPLPTPRTIFRSAEPNRNKNQPSHSITVTFNKEDFKNATAIINNLQIAVEQTYHDLDLFQCMLLQADQPYPYQPYSLLQLYKEFIPRTDNADTTSETSRPTHKFANTMNNIQATLPQRARAKSPTRSPDKKKSRSSSKNDKSKPEQQPSDEENFFVLNSKNDPLAVTHTDSTMPVPSHSSPFSSVSPITQPSQSQPDTYTHRNLPNQTAEMQIMRQDINQLSNQMTLLMNHLRVPQPAQNQPQDQPSATTAQDTEMTQFGSQALKRSRDSPAKTPSSNKDDAHMPDAS